jgi:ornithine carbamoyltransferase
MDPMKRDLRSIQDLTAPNVDEIFRISLDLKAKTKRREPHPLLEGRTLAMIFEKPSLRTRMTFETGMKQLGGHAVYLAPADIGLGKRESVKDVAQCLSRWVDLIMARTFAQATVDELAAEGTIPVINGLSDDEHPCQVLADLLTVKEHRGDLNGLQLAWIGDGNNVCHSLILLCAKMGSHITVASPEGHGPRVKFVDAARADAQTSGAQIKLIRDPSEAVAGADCVFTDTWASMGQESEAGTRAKVFAPYQVNADLLAKAKPDAVVLHCLPAHRGEEITDQVLDGPQSVTLDEAENRLHAQKGLMVFLARNSSV